MNLDFKSKPFKFICIVIVVIIIITLATSDINIIQYFTKKVILIIIALSFTPAVYSYLSGSNQIKRDNLINDTTNAVFSLGTHFTIFYITSLTFRDYFDNNSESHQLLRNFVEFFYGANFLFLISQGILFMYSLQYIIPFFIEVINFLPTKNVGSKLGHKD